MSNYSNTISNNLKSLSERMNSIVEKNPTDTIVLENKKQPQFNLYQKIKPISKNRLDKSIEINFDGRTVWKEYLNPIKNQGRCGSCWAFAMSSALAHRFNILSLGQYNIDLSPAKMILCDWGGIEVNLLEKNNEYRNAINEIVKANINSIKSSACFGNTLEDAGRFLYIMGTNTEECVPYTKHLGNEREFEKIGNYSKTYELPLCIGATGQNGDMCSGYTYDETTGFEGGEPARFYRCYHYYGIYGTSDYNTNGNDYQIMLEIYKWGPVATGFEVYPDFYTFDSKNDIYIWNKIGPKIGGHAVEILGWGISDENIKYWIIRNSWGETWGDNGYFRIRRGTNECGIEQSVCGMLPDFFFKEISTLTNKQNPYSNTLNLKIYNKIGYEENIQDRKNVGDKTSVGGGVNYLNGYSRRTISRYPWLDTNRPVELNKLPIWKLFFAGNVDNNKKMLKNTKAVKDTDDSDTQSIWQKYIFLWIILGSIVLAVIVALVFVV